MRGAVGVLASVLAVVLMSASSAYADDFVTWESKSASGQYLSVQDNSLLNGGAIVTFVNLGTDSNVWYDTQLSDGYWNEITATSLASRNTPDECMEDHGWTANSAVDQWDCVYGDELNEQFAEINTSDVTHPSHGWELVNQGNGQCVRYTGNNARAYYGSCGATASLWL